MPFFAHLALLLVNSPGAGRRSLEQAARNLNGYAGF